MKVRMNESMKGLQGFCLMCVWFPISFLNETIPQFRPPSGRQVAADRTTVGARCVKRTAHRVVSADGAHPIERILPADGAAAALAAHHLGTLGA